MAFKTLGGLVPLLAFIIENSQVVLHCSVFGLDLGKLFVSRLQARLVFRLFEDVDQLEQGFLVLGILLQNSLIGGSRLRQGALLFLHLAELHPALDVVGVLLQVAFQRLGGFVGILTLLIGDCQIVQDIRIFYAGLDGLFIGSRCFGPVLRLGAEIRQQKEHRALKGSWGNPAGVFPGTLLHHPLIYVFGGTAGIL